MAPEDLMLRYQNGEAAAFDALYAQFSGRVRGHLLLRLRDGARADEVLQSIFLKLHRSRHQYQTGSPFAPWLFAITQSVLIDSLRSDAKNPARPSAEDPEVTLNSIADAPSKGNELDALGILERLDPPSREVLEWRYLKELSFEQIASRLGLGPESARQRVSRAVRKLRATGVRP